MSDHEKLWRSLKDDLLHLKEEGNHSLSPSAILLLMGKLEQIADLETMHEDLESRKATRG